LTAVLRQRAMRDSIQGQAKEGVGYVDLIGHMQ
jgi:hypothetical protein